MHHMGQSPGSWMHKGRRAGRAWTIFSSRCWPQKVGCSSPTRLKVAWLVQPGCAHSLWRLLTMPSSLCAAQ